MGKKIYKAFAGLILLLSIFNPAFTTAQEAQNPAEEAEMELKIFQFPRSMIPRIDGKTEDWDIVPSEYIYGLDMLKDIVRGKPNDPESVDVSVTVGWVKGLNRLYFKYEAYNSFWDFKRLDSRTAKSYMNDIFEVVVDGDRSGGVFIKNLLIPDEFENYFHFSGRHAQNYHIFTPPVDGEWCIVWGSQPWIKEFPYANYAYSYDFGQGEPGKLILEFYITPFDYASYRGPEYSLESRLEENKVIGLTWMVLDYKGKRRYDAFYSLSHSGSPWSDADDALPFRLMPLEKKFRKPVKAEWEFRIIDMASRKVAFIDRSSGNITSWKWYFGDGNTSEEQHPVHTYEKAGLRYVVLLEVSGPGGEDKRARYWEVMLK